MSMATSDSRSSSSQQQGSAADTTKKGLPIFNSYMSLFQVQEKLKKGEVIEGVLRINPKNYEDAYISAPGGGTDIYIGGVRDRNAALHGDLVAIELLPPQHWKVLYDQLDYFLDCDDTLKSLVYAAHDPFAVMDQFVPPDSVAPIKQQQNEEELQQATNINTSNNATATDVNRGTENTESCDAGSAKKKKGRRRGKKNKKKEKLESVDEDSTGMVNVAAEELVAGLLSGDPPYQNVQDELILLSSNVMKADQRAASVEARAGKGAKQVIIVPPDMLSECSDVTDDESGCSDSLDLDAAHEDHTFFTAQRAAARRAKKIAEGATVKLVSPSADETSASSTGGVKIVEITDEIEMPMKNETVSEDQTGSNTDSTFVKSDGDSKNEDISAKSEQETITNKQQKKRLTAAERLFGDKAKKSKKNRSKNSKSTALEEVEDGMVTLAIDKETKNAKGSESKSSSGDDCKSVEVAPQEQAQAKSEFAAYSFDDQSMQQVVNSTPLRFMISPYNQQINYSASNSRAQNNWLNHPMLNNFTNNPNPQPMAYQSNQRPSQQQHYGQKRQQQEHQQYGSRQQQSASDGCQRTEPSVDQVMRLSNWGRFVQKVGFVVHILEQRNTRLGAGTLKPFADMNRSFALFSPKDSRIPRMKIPMSQCPPDLFPRRNEYAKRIYLAKITLWNDPKFALGELVRDIGRHGDIMAESEAFLLEIGIDYSEFPQEVLQELPAVPEAGWSIPEEAKAGRLDLRDRCIFSVDPASARDLDDALSCESLPGDRFRVGVHIADVSYFFPAGSELDKFAAGRATSVYLVDKVIPMLPRVLCEQLCSLNPDEDRLAFSVIWEMDRTGHIQSTWFGRTIIRSCAKLSYDHAQLVIDSPGKVDWEEQEFPPISRFPLSQVCQTITSLQGLAVHMRARRHRNGALRLDQSKLAFSLDRETKMPNAVTTTEHKQSNNLIEEFMLLANISVAHKIYESFPGKAVLRCHPEPQVGPLADTVNMLRCMNIEIDISSAGSIYDSILRLTGDSGFSSAQLEVVVNMLSKPMQNALYFCSGSYLEDFSHYALNVPFYTHFTSPIRRYPDVLVHRLLAAAIDPERDPLPDLSLDEIDRRLSVSNEKKTSAKRASEYSCELYLAEFVRQLREIHTSGIVLGVLDRSLDILLLDYCTIKRTYLEKLPLEALNYDNKSKNEPPSLHVVWSPDHNTQSPPIAQSFTYFTPVKVVLTPFTNDQLKFNVTLVRPES